MSNWHLASYKLIDYAVIDVQSLSFKLSNNILWMLWNYVLIQSLSTCKHSQFLTCVSQIPNFCQFTLRLKEAYSNIIFWNWPIHWRENYLSYCFSSNYVDCGFSFICHAHSCIEFCLVFCWPSVECQHEVHRHLPLHNVEYVVSNRVSSQSRQFI